MPSSSCSISLASNETGVQGNADCPGINAGINGGWVVVLGVLVELIDLVDVDLVDPGKISADSEKDVSFTSCKLDKSLDRLLELCIS